MKERSFDEMIAYFNRRVSEMDIARDYKIELLGMIAALGYKHEKTAQQWIPCSERLPEDDTEVFVYLFDRPSPFIAWIDDCHWYTEEFEVEKDNYPLAWMPLPEPYKGGREE